MLDPGDAGERDHGVSFEIGRHLRRSAPGQIIRGSDHDAAHRTDPGRDRGAFREHADAHRDIESLVHQVDRPVEQSERDEHLGKSIEKFGDDRQHVQPSEQDRRSQAQFAARRRALARSRPFDLFEIGEHAPGAAQKPLPRPRSC